ncbi:MAG: class II fumarate hydratase [Lentisphaeraceae bacterium]|nr:class II fumarate hydratase [Lentisphaeraceae bacterium]
MFRTEEDALGKVKVNANDLYGISTHRAIENFPVSGIRMPESFIEALGLIKSVSARVNVDLGQLNDTLGSLIVDAANEVAAGELHEHFPVDVFQTGSATSTNMNVNEVIANKSNMAAGYGAGTYSPVHPNNHVNMGQSSNDVIPSAMNVSLLLQLKRRLVPSLVAMQNVLSQKEKAFEKVLKVGRTHLMDAVPMTMGQQFSGYASQISESVNKINFSIELFRKLPIGGTAVGTGLNCHPSFADRVCKLLTAETGEEFSEADNHFRSQSCLDDAVFLAGVLNTLTATLYKIANDLRLMASGPRAGLNELSLPPLQPGSSIMPGKVNPVMCESIIQVSHYVSGLYQTVLLSGRDGQLQLNTNLPLTSHALLHSIDCLTNGINIFTEKCLINLQVNEEQCQKYIDRTLMKVTALNSIIGYDKASQVAKKAFEENKTLTEVLVELDILSEVEADNLLDAKNMV